MKINDRPSVISMKQGLLFKTCQRIFMYDLGIQRIAVKFVDKDQKQNRVQTSTELKACYEADPNLISNISVDNKLHIKKANYH